MSERRVISIVDDDESLRHALHGFFRSAGLPVVAFTSAEEFLRSDHVRSTACLILDLQLPGMDGLSLQERLAQDDHRIPIIIVTAHGGGDARARALGAGAVAFLRKPFDGDVLLAAVRSALDRR